MSGEPWIPRHEDGHDHHHGHGHGSGGAPRRALTLALTLTFGFMVVEAIAGVWSGSLALLADAGHMLADAGALALALMAQRVAERPRTQRGTYGYRRAEVLAAFVNGIGLALVAAWVLKEAVVRWFEPLHVDASVMLPTALLGLGVNLVVGLLLARGSRHNINLRAAFAHVLFDALGSVGAIVASVLVLTLGWLRADPALSFGIAMLVLLSGFRILKETTDVLLEAAPKNLPVLEIERTICECPGVSGVHDLHVWRISEGFDTLSAHVVLAPGHHGTDVCRAVAERLREVHGLTHVTIQPEAPPPNAIVPLRRGAAGEPLSPP